MTGQTGPANAGQQNGSRWRVVGWSIAASLIVLPLVAMQFTREVNWTVGDFVFAIMMLGSVGLAFELVVRASSNRNYRAGSAAALAGALLTVWVNGAVGMIGSEENAYNLLFFATIGIALAGSVVAKFRAQGMALTMLIAAAAQAAIGLFGMGADPLGGTLSTAFAGIWLLSAALFRRAAREQGTAAN
jgi:hypothetical protein